MTQDISVSYLTNHFTEVQKMLERNYIVRVLNSKSKSVITTMYPGNAKVTKKSKTVTIDDIGDQFLIPITKEQKNNLYEISSQDPSQYSQKPLYRYTTSR